MGELEKDVKMLLMLAFLLSAIILAYLSNGVLAATSTIRGADYLNGYTIINNNGMLALDGSTKSAYPNSVLLNGFAGFNFTLIVNGEPIQLNLISNNYSIVEIPQLKKYVVTMDVNGSTKTLIVYGISDLFQNVNVFDIYNPSNVIEWLKSRWGIGIYTFALLLPASMYLRTKNAGLAAMVLLFMSAAGIALEPSIAPLAVLAIVGAVALLAYKVLWKSEP